MSLKPNFFGLLIGVDYYLNPHFTTLTPTIEDVRCLNEALVDPRRGAYPRDQVTCLVGSDADADAIRGALEALAHVPSDATVFIFFSGHGLRIKMQDQWQTYLCPNNATPYDKAHTLITTDELSQALKAIPAQRLAVILDACHAGGLVTLKDGRQNPLWQPHLPDSVYQQLSQGSGRVVIASSRAEEYSHLHAKEQRSLLTHYVCDALNGAAAVRGDGFIYILDVFHHVSIKVPAQEPTQHPILKADDLTSFPIALAQGGTHQMSQSSSELMHIRQAIINDPLHGASQLSAFVATVPNGNQWLIRIDLRRAELQRIQDGEDLFLHLSSDQKLLREQAIYDLFQVCSEIEQQSAM